MDIIENFRKNSVISNNIYQSVDFFWHVGDQLGKLNEQKSSNNDNSNDNFENLWESLFTKLIVITGDNSPEVRQSSIITITKLITTNMKFFSSKFWLKISKDLFIKQIDKIYLKILKNYEENPHEHPQFHLQTPKFSGIPETPKFTIPSDNNSINLMLNHISAYEKILNLKAWENTLIMLFQSLQKINKRAFLISDIDESLIQLYIFIFSKFKEIISFLNQELVFEFFILIKDFVQNKPVQALKTFDFVKEMLLDYQNSMNHITGEDKMQSKVALQQILPQTMHIYALYLNFCIQETNCIVIMNSFIEFFKAAVQFAKKVDSYGVVSHFNLNDDNTFYNVIKEFEGFILLKSEQVQNQMLLFMIDILNMQINDRISYLVVLKFMNFFANFIINIDFQENIQQVFIQYFLAKIEVLVELRYDYQYLCFHQKLPKNFQFIWKQAFGVFFQIAEFLIKKHKSINHNLFIIFENLLQRPKEKIDQFQNEDQNLIIQEISKIEQACIEFIIAQMNDENLVLDDEQYK
ncbi:hypothetical protein IMG5_111100 [Ichthyophthirius multifiliis]|uniref:Uncharacterized protein n=1 Tax=Ichthyophthirius multifiliis TaxID=5932 RepID=G0QTS5_ICHMU|nr:hypothetical protein IMG5_111100 [Ichthyophthirius multifiliis]EGR31375.1 hypothetical protein IMG5_111100 [Ichthyophthirius multifiliis]|eukprot:XP_004034861.1 hypothetical protein IMG5_111100 [Ichthyophthirius multifiliis]